MVLETITFPEPVIFVAVEPKTKADQEKMADALQKLAEEDPTFRVRLDENTGQTLIGGMGELHLEVLVTRMIREFRVAVKVGRPQVAYRETVTRPARAQGRFVSQTGGRGQFGDVVLDIEPLAQGIRVSCLSSALVGGVRSEGVCARHSAGCGRGAWQWCSGWLSGHRCEGHPGGWFVSRGGLVGDGVQDRRFDGFQRGGRPRQRRCCWSPS